MVSRRLGRSSGSALLAFVLMAGTAVGLVGWFPISPCPTCRGQVYHDRMRYTTLPGVTPKQAAAIRAFAESDSCRRCRRGRMTIFETWFRSSGSIRCSR